MIRKYIIVADDSIKGFDEGIAQLKREWDAEEIEPCEDCISRQFMYELGATCIATRDKNNKLIALGTIENLPPVTPQQKIGYCKNCKYFEYDSVAKVDGIPLIIAHEICKKWGDGCKTKEDGYCFMFELQESEDEE